ncbi:PAS domain S-box protein [Candidatus Accumulibacter sp. ACC003]|uniref:PAS domain S-box protein n=1 Tax=Candidatus Accumulibacter sp. ACC003 TaxID=2823334 RepID=UPI0025B7B275|nr:PAS domain S-box protein [Candidatus Accumulibacter sp. ACC003]
MENSELDGRVLGQLMLMQGVAASLPDQAIRSFVTAGLGDIPGVGKVEFRARVGAAESSTRNFVVATDSTSFGELVFSVSDARVFALYADHIENFAFILALTMDERQQRRKIERYGRDLEQQVAERTRQLSESERRFQGLLANVRMLAVMLDVRGKVTFCNDFLLELTGWQRSEVIGQDWFEIFLPEPFRVRVRAVFSAAMASGSMPERFENELLTRQGERRLVVWDNTVMRDGQGQIIGTASLGVDATERIEAEESLAVSEERYRSIFQNASMGIFNSTVQGQFLRVNPALARSLGYASPEELLAAVADIGTQLYVDPAGRRPLVEAAIEKRGEWAHAENRYRRKDGSILIGDLMQRTVMNKDGTLAYLEGFVQDITERKVAEFEKAEQMLRLQELNSKLEDVQYQLLQSEKMASIGQLAAGVAHEINNPVAFVDANLRSLEGYLYDVFQFVDACQAAVSTPESRTRLNTLKVAMDYDYLKTDAFLLMTESRDGLARVAKIVRDMKDFARPGEGEWQLASVHEGLNSTLNIIWNEIKYHCTLTKRYAPDLPLIRCLPAQLNQVFLNLLVNAAHAIDGKGEITISTERIGDDSVGIRIHDTGQGIKAEHLKRIFEPFFTTKPVGKGTGLGLSIVWGIVGKHTGSIDVISVAGQGTTFLLRLPIDARSAK